MDCMAAVIVVYLLLIILFSLYKLAECGVRWILLRLDP